MSLIDWNKVNELRNEVGAEDFDEVVELFLEEVEQVISQLGNEGRSPEHDLHFLKGSALNLGFAHFSNLCSAGETAANQGHLEGLDFGEITMSYEQSKSGFLEGLTTKLAS